MSPRTTVLGAGLSGMVAAINLAREGEEVLVLDQAKAIGGSTNFHPSVHITMLNHPLLWEYSRVNLDSGFVPLESYDISFGGELFAMNPSCLYVVERGHRPKTLDNMLYKMALEAGVKFEFGVKISRAEELREMSIVATGLHPEMYEVLSIPYKHISGFYFRRETTELDRCAIAYFDDYTTTYFYAAGLNGLLYGLIFSTRPITGEGLKKLSGQLERVEGFTDIVWEEFSCRVPLGSPNNPRLFADWCVLAGSIAGFMDPALMFGIHGAILSGRVASTAVDDPLIAMRDLRGFTRKFRSTYYLGKVIRHVPGRTNQGREMMRSPLRFKRLITPAFSGTPGISDARLTSIFDNENIQLRPRTPTLK